jgi:hypothetical protein
VKLRQRLVRVPEREHEEDDQDDEHLLFLRRPLLGGVIRTLRGHGYPLVVVVEVVEVEVEVEVELVPVVEVVAAAVTGSGAAPATCPKTYASTVMVALSDLPRPAGVSVTCWTEKSRPVA